MRSNTEIVLQAATRSSGHLPWQHLVKLGVSQPGCFTLIHPTGRVRISPVLRVLVCVFGVGEEFRQVQVPVSTAVVTQSGPVHREPPVALLHPRSPPFLPPANVTLFSISVLSFQGYTSGIIKSVTFWAWSFSLSRIPSRFT